MASKLQLPPLNFESRGSLTADLKADFHIPDSPPHSRPGSPSRYQNGTDATNDSSNASARIPKPKSQLGLTNKPSSSSLQVSPNSPPMSPQSPRPVSVRRLLSKMSLSGSYKESDEASIMSLKSPTNTSPPFLKDRDPDVASERALSISSKGFFSSFRRNSSKRSVSSSSGRKASLPPPTPREREPPIAEKTTEVGKKDPAPQIPDLPQTSVSSFDTDLFKNI
ncbi:hypothetical protein TWF506_005636 [Arthrobotrys conoides]|uniref:Uncharacterized protein n=1 Tax=Arthrobotrys conoides TaxID=74498 RepID=A0AAN8RW51_9PEZI